MKKSIAVLSLTIAGALGIVACGGNSGTNSNSSASASASASATASATASAPASTSAAATSKSTTSAATETTKAETKTTQGTISTPSGLPSEATEALKKVGIRRSGSLRRLHRQQESPGAAQERVGVKKAQTSDGTVYYTDKLAAFESKDGAIVSIQNNGVWTSMDSNGTTIVVSEDGSWIKTNPKDNLYTVVKADGTASVLNTKTFEQATDVSTIETPKFYRIDGFSGTAKTPVKPTKIGDLSEVAGAK